MGLRIFLDAFFILGVVFLTIAIVVKVSFEKKKESCTQMVEASIVEINKMERTESGSDPQYVSYFPVYEYEYMGKIYRKGSNVGNLEKAFEIGKKVWIYIDPENPEKIYEDSSVPKIIVRIFGIIGVTFVVIPIFLRFILLG